MSFLIRHTNRFASMLKATNVASSVHFTKNNEDIFCNRRYITLNSRKQSNTVGDKNQNPTAYASITSSELTAAFPDVLQILTTETAKYNLDENWFKQLVEYNVPAGDKLRGSIAVLPYQLLVKEEDKTPENVKLSQYLGWGIEMLNCQYLMLDDIICGGENRWGKKCWYKHEGVGLRAINDAALIHSVIFVLLKEKFSHLSCYMDLVELFGKATFITNAGQAADAIMAKRNITTFNMNEYKSLCYHKTGYYSVSVPLLSGMHLTSFNNPTMLQKIKATLKEMGCYFQANVDYFDYFESPNYNSKIETEIEENKWSWLAIKGLEKANKEQKQILRKCYGQKGTDNVAEVKKIYDDLKLRDEFALYKEEYFRTIDGLIKEISDDKLQNVLRLTMGVIRNNYRKQ